MRTKKGQAAFLMGVVWAVVTLLLISLAQTIVSDPEPGEMSCPVKPCHLTTESMD